ncbi:MAG TPA: DNA repair protein RecO [Puia sp.]|jgi:DNA repair protein RecO (recombination protein O)|nr:DNA repair protein RecO [Puia sp.]
MVHKTKGIVLRTVKYGETSVIVTILTELFGLQSYLVNSVRTSKGRGGSKAGMFQPAAILDLVIYHQESKNLNRLKEYSWSFLYKNILTDVISNSIALFMIELLQKCLKQPESNTELFYFMEDTLTGLDQAERNVQANFPLFFALHLAGFFGLRIDDNYSGTRNYLDLKEGYFTGERPLHPHYLDHSLSEATAYLLRVKQPAELADLPLNKDKRRFLMDAYEDFYSMHIQGFTPLKTLPVLRTLLEV